MPLRVLQTGLHPDRVDFSSPEFRRFEGLTQEALARANDGGAVQTLGELYV